MLVRWLLDVSSQPIFYFWTENRCHCEMGGLVPAFSHPGAPFWDLGDILGDRGSSRKDMRWSGIEIGSISGPLGNPILRVFKTPRANMLFSLRARFCFFCANLHDEIGMPGPPETRFLD